MLREELWITPSSFFTDRAEATFSTEKDVISENLRDISNSFSMTYDKNRIACHKNEKNRLRVCITNLRTPFTGSDERRGWGGTEG
ncbi:hypothetical protein [Celeribacter arenosi]|uniref:Uncharacterized protein n=1 Tax=Celeribacter arenosi TaxID=792649 RepID=A0ABP7JX94_9RHOB